MKAHLLFIFACAACGLAVTQPASADGSEIRTALVVGCDYPGTSLQLPSPAKDAKNIAGVLQDTLGFRVTVLTNPTRKELLEAVDRFGADLTRNKGVGLFYFSGHGAQHEGENYFIPAKAELGFREDLPSETVSAQRIVTRMEAAKNRVNLLFLDACRTNELPSSRLAAKGLVAKGLAAMNAASGMLISFATARNSAANDSGKGSFYTNALIRHIATPGISVTDMLTEVNNEVKRETGGAQIPFMEVGLDGIFRFVDSGSAPPASIARSTTSAPVSQPPAPAAPTDIFQDSPYTAYNAYTKEIILRRVQDKLSATGYYLGAIDGKASPALQQALMDYQRTFNLPANGALDSTTLASIKLDSLKERTAPRVASEEPEIRPVKPQQQNATPRPVATTPKTAPQSSEDLDAKFKRAAEMFEKKK